MKGFFVAFLSFASLDCTQFSHPRQSALAFPSFSSLLGAHYDVFDDELSPLSYLTTLSCMHAFSISIAISLSHLQSLTSNAYIHFHL